MIEQFSMKSILSILFLFISFNLFAQKSVPKPNPSRLFNDLAGIVDKYDADGIERKLVALDDSTSNQIAIVTVKSLNGEVLEDVATNTFREWGIGNKKTNNGVLVLIAMQERRIRIEVGYGLEGAIPDIVASDIIENDLKPAFKQGNYVAGINKAIDDLSKAAVGEYKVARSLNDSLSEPVKMLIGISFFVVIFLIILIGRRNGGGGGYANRSGFKNVASNLFWMSLLNSGSDSGGSDWGGGGGGFGGFGGGSSGGGGASGGW